LIHQTTSNIKKIFPKRVSYQASSTYSLGEFPGVITEGICLLHHGEREREREREIDRASERGSERVDGSTD
jgi:hypothetical protein